MAQPYILSAYQQAEEFLQAFRNEHPRSPAWTYAHIEESDLFQRVAVNIANDWASGRANAQVAEAIAFLVWPACGTLSHFRSDTTGDSGQRRSYSPASPGVNSMPPPRESGI